MRTHMLIEVRVECATLLLAHHWCPGCTGAEIVVEEFLDGEEASFFALIDGETCVALASAQDHKAVGEGDTGTPTQVSWLRSIQVSKLPILVAACKSSIG